MLTSTESMATPFTARFEGGVTVSDAETLISGISNWSDSFSEVNLDFSDCKHFNAGVGWRIGNALSQFGDVKLVVVVPDPAVPPGFSGRWFNLFTRSGLGLSLVRYASEIRTVDRDVTQEVRDYYGKMFFHHLQAAPNSVTLTDLAGSHVSTSSPSTFFDHHLSPYLRRCNVNPEVYPDHFWGINSICFEAIQNVADHADKCLSTEKRRPLSYFGIRYYKTLSAEQDAPGDFRGYIERAGNLGNQGPAKAPPQFLEIIVNDDGVGIPARFGQRRDIYVGDIDDERTTLVDALKTASSVKYLLNDAPARNRSGYGYTFIRQSLMKLQAFAVLRTGRCMMRFDGTRDNQTEFVLDEAPLGYMPGTALHVLLRIPVIQPRLEGF